MKNDFDRLKEYADENDLRCNKSNIGINFVREYNNLEHVCIRPNMTVEFSGVMATGVCTFEEAKRLLSQAI